MVSQKSLFVHKEVDIILNLCKKGTYHICMYYTALQKQGFVYLDILANFDVFKCPVYEFITESIGYIVDHWTQLDRRG